MTLNSSRLPGARGGVLNKVLYGEAPPPPFTLLYTTFYRKDTPFLYVLLATLALEMHITPFTYLGCNFASLLTTVNALSSKYE